ncbi:MAG: hypothetical protein IJS20_07095 [Bacteroidales bacterium]|nr:hypothetical protein [Bacteroidales bacterium]
MNTKLLIKIILTVVIIATLNSCKKEDSAPVAASNPNENVEVISQNREGQLRQIPYQSIIDDLEEEYDCCFDFNSITTVTTPTGVAAANILVLPSTWFDDWFLTIIINGSAQLIGVYEVQFTSGFSANIRDIETNSYGFAIYYGPTNNDIFTGFVYMNVPNISDYISTFGNPFYHNYPYPLFDYYTTSATNLEDYVVAFDTTGMTPLKIACKLGSTFYIHFYLGL